MPLGVARGCVVDVVAFLHATNLVTLCSIYYLLNKRTKYTCCCHRQIFCGPKHDHFYQKQINSNQKHLRVLTLYFEETLLRPQRMVAELRQVGPLVKLAVGGVLDHFKLK